MKGCERFPDDLKLPDNSILNKPILHELFYRYAFQILLYSGHGIEDMLKKDFVILLHTAAPYLFLRKAGCMGSMPFR